MFKDYDPNNGFVRRERKWITVDSQSYKTAFCGVYAGFQAYDDRHGAWNDAIYAVLRSEILQLRVKGYRIVLVGDFNYHVGDSLEH